MKSRHLFLLVPLILSSSLWGKVELSFSESGQLQISNEGKVLVTSPSEGLWSVGLNWRNNWVADWKHVSPDQIEQVNGSTVVRSQLVLESGTLLFRDIYHVEETGVRCLRRVTWTGAERLDKVTLSVRLMTPALNNKLVIPSMVYHGNPNGEKSGSRTPVWYGKKGETLLLEEHRIPMPYVSQEWNEGNAIWGAALHSFPCPVAFGNQKDQWWTLGAVGHENGTELVLLSGPPAMNGEYSVVKAHNGKADNLFMKYDQAYLALAPQAVIEKSYFIQAYPVDRIGNGLETPTLASIELHKAHQLLESFPTYESIVKSKYQYAQERWLEGDGYAGYNQFESGDPYIVWGWVGQAAAPGYSMQLLKDDFGECSDSAKVQKSLDFLSDSVFYEDGFYTWFNVETGKWQIRIWRPMPEFLSQGQGMWNMANAIRVGRKNGYDVENWETFLKEACDFYRDRVLADDWNPKSTNEGFFIAPLAKASSLFGRPDYLQAAEFTAQYYADRHLTMDEPYWGGTLDASCEDKEGAFAAFQGFLSLYETTGKSVYLDWAKHAGMVCLSYLQVWDIDMPAGRLRDHNFKSRGWTGVSVQNHHLDVYGVLIAPDVYRLGVALDNEILMETAKLMFRSCGQLIDYKGSQGEQVQQTFYSQGKEGIEGAPMSYRGDYVEDWTVFWITAHFLNAAAQFEELGVNWD